MEASHREHGDHRACKFVWSHALRRSGVLFRLRFFVWFLLPLAFKLQTFGVQQAWVAKYTHGSNSQAVALALDKDGNIYVAGHSTRTNAPFDYDYVVIKYN